MLTVPTCTSTQGERYQETMKLVLSMFYALLSPDNHLSLTRNTNSVTSKSSIVCCSSKLLCLGCCQHRISTQRNRDYLHWPHSKWRPVGYHRYIKEGVVLERVYRSNTFSVILNFLWAWSLNDVLRIHSDFLTWVVADIPTT